MTDKAIKRATTITLVVMGTGLLGLYSLTGNRTCTTPDPANPEYIRLKQAYDQCVSRRSSSSARSSTWGYSSGAGSSSTSATNVSSTATRGGFGGAGTSAGG